MQKISCRQVISDGAVLDNIILSIDGDKIVEISHDKRLSSFDFEQLSPGLIDLHINGGEQYHFTASPDIDTLYDIEVSGLKNGTTHTLPTIITAPFEIMEKANEALTDYYKMAPQSGILGIHFEGPFLSPAKRGAHLMTYLQQPSENNIERLKKLTHGKLLTIAPELFSEDQIKKVLGLPMKVAIGHSDATFDQARSGMSLGIHLVTHLYNAMRGFGHRDLGVVGAALYHDHIYCPIILDGHHLTKEAAQMAWRLKGEKLFLISDALFQNHIKQNFIWGQFDAHYHNGTYFNSEGNLAGASINMWDAVQNAMKWFDISLAQALKMATSIPASLMVTDRKIGKIMTGYEAKLIQIKNDECEFVSL